MSPLDACPCCGERRAVHLFTVDGYEHVRCASCDSARIDPLPDFDPVELYDEGYFRGAAHGGYLDYDADADLHRRNAKARLDRITSVLPRREQLRHIDVGCASGYTLDEGRARGWASIGVDASAHARDRATARGHIAVASIAEAVHAGEPDVVTFFQVLEHIVDAAGALCQAATSLTPGGVVAIETWDRASRIARAMGSTWQQANPPSVIHLFTADGVSRMVERVGLRLVSLKPTSKLVSVGLVAGVAAHRYGAAGRALRSASQATHLTKLAVPYRLGDLVTAIAIKP